MMKHRHTKKRRSDGKRWLVASLALGAIALLIVSGLALVVAQRRRAASSVARTSPRTVRLTAGDDLQAAIDEAQAGDTIALEPGAAFRGSFVLPKKTGDAYITIQSSALDRLPAAHTRVAPEDAINMPRILTPGKGEPALKTAAGAHHYRFVGIEFAPANKDYIYNLIYLEAPKQTKLEDVPHHLVFDRCYVHAYPTGVTRRGFGLNSAATEILNSYVAGFGAPGEEAQAVAGWNGPGPFRLINNYLEGGAENVLFGGDDPTIPNLVPSDIEIRGNHFSKPLAWRGRVAVKNIFELKNARRVKIDSNLFEHGFDAEALRFTVRNQSGGAPWSTIEDIEFTNNVVRRAGIGVSVLGRDDNYPSGQMRNLRIENNLFDDINDKRWGSAGWFLKITDGVDVRFLKNTIMNTGNLISVYGKAPGKFVFRDNIAAYNEYGIAGADVGRAEVYDRYFPDGVFTNNVLIDTHGLGLTDDMLPPGNFIAPSLLRVGFTDLARGDYRLGATSRYRGRARDKTNPGCDFDKLKTAFAAAEPHAVFRLEP